MENSKQNTNAQNVDLPSEFSFDTIKDFDSHIELSIPNYKHIWELIKSLSSYFIVKNSNVYDLGCSTGIGLKLLSFKNKAENIRFIGYDISENLLKDSHNTKHFSVFNSDITDENTTFPNASLILMVFTLQFLPITKKQGVLKRIYDSLLPGGGFIICEKTINESGKLQDIFTFSYYDFKEQNFTKDQILSKQYDLRFIMKNNTDEEITNMIKSVGFKYIEPFFQSLQFKGYLCIK
ncbi:MAG TPA: methyltransferase [Paludibacter sp.]